METTFAVIAVLPNLDGNGKILLLSGITMEATEAAGELMTSAGFPSMMAKLLPGGGANGERPWFELLIKSTSMAGASRSAEIVAHRTYATFRN